MGQREKVNFNRFAKGATVNPNHWETGDCRDRTANTLTRLEASPSSPSCPFSVQPCRWCSGSQSHSLLRDCGCGGREGEDTVNELERRLRYSWSTEGKVEGAFA